MSRPAERVWVPGRRLMTVGLIATVTLFALESLAIATVMPIVEGELGDLWLYGWVFSGFFLGQVLGITMAGRLCDKVAPIQPFAAGLVLFVGGLIAGGLAQSMVMLVAARVVQGLGSGAIPAVAYVVIARAYPGEIRPRMFALLSTAWVVPAVLGPGIAGIVGETVGWRAVFLGLVPIVVVAGVVALSALRTLPAVEARSDERLPLGRALQVTAGAGLLVLGFSLHNAVAFAGLVAAGLVVTVPAFRSLTPPGTLQARPGMPAAIAVRGVTTFAFFGAEAFVPYLLDEVRGLSASQAGSALTGAALVWTSAAWVQERTVHRVGPRRLVQIGASLLVSGAALVAATTVLGAPVAFVYVGWAFAGAGMGLSFAPQSLVVLGAATEGGEGRSTSALHLSDVLGVALGTGVAGALVSLGESQGWDVTRTLAGVFAVSVATGLLALAIAGRLPRVVPGADHVEEHLTTAVAVA